MATSTQSVAGICLLLYALTGPTVESPGAPVRSQEAQMEQRVRELEQRLGELQERLANLRREQEVQVRGVEEKVGRLLDVSTTLGNELRDVQRRQQEDGRIIDKQEKAIVLLQETLKKCCSPKKPDSTGQ
jgi:chromosome segregation ATPase